MKSKLTRPSSSRVKKYLKYGLSSGRVFLHDLASAVGWIMMRGHYGMGWAEYEERQERRDAYKEREWLRMLMRQKCIETKRIGTTLMVRLTAKGWQQAMRDKIRCTPRERKGGSICIVVFDIPESERHVRNALRHILKECRFTMLQKSVWVTRKDVVSELCALLQGAKLDQWVQILTGQTLKTSFIRRSATRIATHIKGV